MNLLSPPEYEQSFSSLRPVEWKCIVGNLKKWKNKTIDWTFIHNKKQYILTAEKIKKEGEAWRIRFIWDSNEITFGDVMEDSGHIPLPPYIKREDEKDDYIRYQTIYSRIKGSVAAPTAGLHFTDKLYNRIKDKGIDSAEITLHVGAGTFQPVKADNISNHEMHSEHYFVTRENLEKILRNKNRIIAVGTTSVRTLESLYWLGIRILEKNIKIR